MPRNRFGRVYKGLDWTKYKQTHIKETTFSAHAPKPPTIRNRLNQKSEPEVKSLCFKGTRGPTSYLENIGQLFVSNNPS